MNKKKECIGETVDKDTIIPVEEQPYAVPENWVWTKLGNVVVFYSGSAFPKAYQGMKEKDLSFYKVGSLKEIDNDFFLKKSIDTIDEEIRKKLKAKLIPTSTILFAKIGEAIKLNRRALVKREACIDNNLMGMRGIEGILETKFLFYWSLMEDFYQYSQATAVPSIRKSTLEAVLFPLPPLDEQKRIAEKLECILNEIEKAKKLIGEARETFELRRIAILDKAFRGELTKKWREKNSNEQLSDELLEKIRNKKEEIYLELVDQANKEGNKKPQRSKKFDNKINQENLLSLPKNWSYCMLGDIIYDFKYGTSNKSDYNFKGTPVIRIPNIGEEFINTHDLKYLQESNSDFNSLVKDGDLLIVRSNGSKRLVGKCSIVQKREENYAFASYLIRLRPVLVIPEYILWLLKSDRVKEQFFSKSKSSAGINNINTEELATTIIPLPPIEEQREIVDKIKSLLTKEDESKKILALDNYIDNLKQSILFKAFRGKLGTNDPNEENSIELLKEILQKQVK